MRYFAHESAVIDAPVSIGNETKIWHFTHICANCTIGPNCNIGQNVMVGTGVSIGSNVKIQNNVSVYSGILIEDDVFLGPSCVFTNVSNPRSQISRRELYEETVVRRGATIGANATIICGISLGRYCFVAAGAVVTKDVADYSLMVGVPAKKAGWMSRHGHRLILDLKGMLVCPESGFRYVEESPDILRCLDLEEDAPLPAELRVGKSRYSEFKR